ncbi:hypothetical protein FAES_3348 [Fibrella aestuarina BUZ 2]|uniref:Co-chaperone DjlA N-terminal domain-containing protein n=1 Tax=Fibrella aestuarina BUZ 2 TaxID=1166018 RepID=I0KB53_9BACT|nr:TerB family tellurite resistance protein [Fibrella aestuarina]CCH01356.1 hypothetical protein FAES_3348 [Fibrella aestuarina BUZ 2]
MIQNTETPDLYIGLGSLIYALAKVDGNFQLDEMQTAKEILAKEPHGELALYALMLREEYDETVEEAYAFAMRRFSSQRDQFDKPTQKRFLDLLQRIANAHDDVSRKEQALIDRFRRDARRLRALPSGQPSRPTPVS